jgi:hypothetical protein
MTPGVDRLESRQLLSTASPHHQGVAITAAPAEIFVHSGFRPAGPHGHAAAAHTGPAYVAAHPVAGLHTTGRGRTSGGLSAAVAISLSGLVDGTTSIQGSEIGLNGAGMVSPLGPVTSRGSVEFSGGNRVKYIGTVTLNNQYGSVTVGLSGQGSISPRSGPPINLTYTILGGTGRYSGDQGSGSASLTISVQGDRFDLTFGSGMPPV